MALDKVVDSAILDAGLTKIANAIRAKGGTDGTMQFPDGFAALVEAIEAGSGGDTLFGHYWEHGTITPADDITSDYNITFEKRFPYNVALSANYTVFVWYDSASSGNQMVPNNSWVWQTMGIKGRNASFVYGQYTSNNGGILDANYGGIIGSNSSSNKYTIQCSTSKALKAGKTYNWIAVGAD